MGLNKNNQNNINVRLCLVRITVLNYNEEPIENIEGQVSSGTISIDGDSSLRRTFNFTLIAQDLNIHNLFWGLRNKIKLEIGEKSLLNGNILWHPYGIFIITQFNISQSLTSFSISISGKDKMCLLNGDLGGALPSVTDFGKEEIYDKTQNIKSYKKIPIKKIILESIHTFAKEPYSNIIIQDLDEENSIEILEYRGKTPLYLFKDIYSNNFVNFTTDGQVKIYKKDIPSQIFDIQDLELYGGQFEKNLTRQLIQHQNDPTKIIFSDDKEKKIYTIMKVEYKENVGYRYTDLVYPSDLIVNAGAPLTQMLDKIKSMLGNYEYFYDVYGRFIFRRKKNYLFHSWNNIQQENDQFYIDDSSFSTPYNYIFEDKSLIKGIQNSPKINSLKNDFSIWGKRESILGEKIPIHYRYAIDKKPSEYSSINFSSKEAEEYSQKKEGVSLKVQQSKNYKTPDYDWREILFQMAKDFYQYGHLDCYEKKIIESNKKSDLFQNGMTGYEQYYSDIFGFWRTIYNPETPIEYIDYQDNKNREKISYIPSSSSEKVLDLFIQGRYKKIESQTEKEYLNRKEILTIIEINDNQKYWYELHPLLDVIELKEYDNASNSQYWEKNSKAEIVSSIYYEKKNNQYVPISWESRHRVNKEDIFYYEKTLNAFYYLEDSPLNKKYLKSLYYFDKDDKNFYQIQDFLDHENDDKLKGLYLDEKEYSYNLYFYESFLDKVTGQPILPIKKIKKLIPYKIKNCNFFSEKDAPITSLKFWNKNIISSPEDLTFWFDFLDSDISDIGYFSVKKIGDRLKVINKDEISLIQHQEIPNLIFISPEDYLPDLQVLKSGYQFVFSSRNLQSLFTISRKKYSAQEEIDICIQKCSQCIESSTATLIPIYDLVPNTKILIKDDKNKMSGEFIINKINYSLNNDRNMTLSLTKVPERIV